MKKQVWVILLLVLCMTTSMILTSCYIGGETCTSHIDENGDGKCDACGETVSTPPVTSNKLATPTNVQIEGNVVTWDAVAGANRYIVYVTCGTYAKDYMCTTNTYSLAEKDAGEYTIKVKAIDATEQYSESELSAEITYTILKTVLGTPVLEIENRIVSWGVVAHATGYKVFVNGEEDTAADISIDGGICTYNVTFTQPGNYEIKVIAFDYNDEYISGNESESVYFFVPTPDSLGQWGTTGLTALWNGFGSSVGQGAYLYIHGANEATNYVAIPANAKYLSIALLPFGTENLPKISLYVKGSADDGYSVVRAIGATEDAATMTEGNITVFYTYDLNAFSGNADIKFVFERTTGDVAISVQAIGFHSGDATSAKTEWSSDELFIDWKFNGSVNMNIKNADGVETPVIHPATTATMENKIGITAGKSLFTINALEAGSMYQLYINDVLFEGRQILDGLTYKYDLAEYAGQEVTIKIVPTAWYRIESMALAEGSIPV